MQNKEELKNNFNKEVENTIVMYKNAVGGFTPNTDKILYNSDKINSLSNLMKSGEAQKGFKILRNSNKLDKTFEALVIKYKKLFTEKVIIAAQWRLDNAWEMDKK